MRADALRTFIGRPLRGHFRPCACLAVFVVAAHVCAAAAAARNVASEQRQTVGKLLSQAIVYVTSKHRKGSDQNTKYVNEPLSGALPLRVVRLAGALRLRDGQLDSFKLGRNNSPTRRLCSQFFARFRRIQLAAAGSGAARRRALRLTRLGSARLGLAWLGPPTRSSETT